MNLKLYKIVYRNEISAKEWFAFILADCRATAYASWIKHMVPSKNIYTTERWAQLYVRTEIIDGPFENGFIICNVGGI